MAVEDSEYLQFGRLRVGVAGAAEMDGERALITVPRSEILRIESIRTTGGERPLLTLIVGFVLLAIAVLPVLTLVDVLNHGGTYHAEWIGAVACGIPAIWLIDLSVRRRWILLVTTRRDRRKLLFPKGSTQVEAETFVARARDRFGYS